MQKLNTNVSPIFDDFDESKNFHRILFNAGNTVQARELTQAQTILQSQIERLGKHLFTEGSMVVPGGVTAVESQDYMKLSFINSAQFSDISGEADLYVKSNANGLIAKVAKTFDADSTDPVSIFFDILTPGSNQEKVFINAEVVTFFVYNSDNSTRNLAQATVSGTGKGAWIKVQAGVYFVRGSFVRTDYQDYVISKYTTDKSMKLGFEVVEEIVTAAEDSSLYSNANGYPNYNSVGASRLKITLNLIGLDLVATDDNFIEIARFDQGALANVVDYTSYSLIEQSIAKRTYETSGDYVVNQFGLDLKEHLNNGTNGGVYTDAYGGDATKLVAAVKPGVAYVKGYRVDNVGIQNVVFNKARETAFLNNAAYSVDYGQYLLVHNMKSLPDIDIKKRLLLLDSTLAQIGTAAVRAIRKDGTSYRIYVFDINMIYGKLISNVTSVKYTDANNLFTADLVSSVLYDTTKSSLVFPLPITAVKTLASGSGTDTSYTVLRTYNLTTNSSGVVSVSANANEMFAPIDGNQYFIGLTGVANVGTLFDPVASLSLSGTIVGTTLNINLGSGQAGQAIKVIAPVIKNQTTQKSKTLVVVNDEIITFADTNKQALTKADVYDLVSVVDNTTNEDITSLFGVESGQKDNWYESGKLVVLDSSIIERTVKVTYRYFNHSAGDYFTVDSYAGLTREQTPSYNGLNLCDAIDFRPLKDATGAFTSATVFGEIVRPGDSVRADITYYLSRSDAVCVDSNGVFSVLSGISSLTPTVPVIPADLMKLYELFIPAYTMKVSDIGIKTIDNKRYTMRDIGNLENRIANVEYYTSLSALENSANKVNVIDPVTGTNRFKNGFAADGFADFKLADTTNADWAASIDFNNNILRPTFQQNVADISDTPTLSNAVMPNNVAMKAYTEVQAISQPYATGTININPYAVYSWQGNVKLTPDRDYWIDTVYTTPVLVNNTINLTYEKSNSYNNPALQATGEFGNWTWGPNGQPLLGYAWGDWTHPSTDVTGHGTGWQDTEYQVQLYKVEFDAKTSSSSSSQVVGTNIIPFMRSINIGFSCSGFRPFTRIYPFFDSVDVSQDCKPTGGNYGDPIITNSAGSVTGNFLVPNKKGKVFKTGTTVFKFTDSPTDSQVSGDVTTDGSAKFTSGGTSQTVQTTTTNTTEYYEVDTPTGTVRYLDPIAQTFIIPDNLSSGCFVTKFEVFFKSKARSVPVTMQLRSVTNGLPTSNVIGSVTLDPSLVNVSDDATLATAFQFPDPVFLKSGSEYAIILIANTQEYQVYLAEQGKNVIGQQMALSKQAYMGVFLTSSNSSTWNAEQTKDLMFNMYRAKFSTDASTVVFNNIDPVVIPLTFNAIYTTASSNTVSVHMRSHGLKAGDKVTISGAVGGNGLQDSDLNGQKTVLSSDVDSFTYQATNVANATGSLGGSVIGAVANYPFNLINANVDAVSPNGTSIVWEYSYKSQVNRLQSAWIKFNPGKDFNTPSEAVVKAAGDFQIRATLNTTVDSISPMVEVNGMTCALISPRVDNTANIFNYVTTEIMFDNPTTHARFLVGSKLPGSSGMRLFVKEIDTADQDVAATSWVELQAKTPITNSESYVEYEFDMDGTFVGFKVKIELTGSNENPPSLSDFRAIAYA